MFVAVTCINVLYLKVHSRQHIRQRPELAAGYRRLIRGYLFWGNLPWIVMGVGLELGGLSSIFSFFRPRDGNPFVLAFFLVVIELWILGFWWLFFARGAEFLVEHPGVFRGLRAAQPSFAYTIVSASPAELLAFSSCGSQIFQCSPNDA